MSGGACALRRGAAPGAVPLGIPGVGGARAWSGGELGSGGVHHDVGRPVFTGAVRHGGRLSQHVAPQRGDAGDGLQVGSQFSNSV